MYDRCVFNRATCHTLVYRPITLLDFRCYTHSDAGWCQFRRNEKTIVNERRDMVNAETRGANEVSASLRVSSGFKDRKPAMN